MNDSILLEIKKKLGSMNDYAAFDTDIVISINTSLMVLNQLGVGKQNYRVRDETQTWSEFLEGREDLEGVKDYIFLKVKLKFDPPNSSFVIQAMKEEIQELEWRLNIEAERSDGDGHPNGR